MRRLLPVMALVAAAAIAVAANLSPLSAWWATPPTPPLPTRISQTWSFASPRLAGGLPARLAAVVGTEVILPSGPTPSLSGDLEAHDVATGRTRFWRQDFPLDDDLSVMAGSVLVQAGNRSGPGVVTGFGVGRDRNLWTRVLPVHADALVVAGGKAVLTWGSTIQALLPDSGRTAWEKPLDCAPTGLESWGRYAVLDEQCGVEPGYRRLVLDARDGTQVLEERVGEGKTTALRGALGELVVRESSGGLELVGAGGVVRHRVPGPGLTVDQVIWRPEGGLVIVAAEDGRSLTAYDGTAKPLWRQPGVAGFDIDDEDSVVSPDHRFAYSLLNPNTDDVVTFLDVRSLADGRRAIFPLPVHRQGATILGVSGDSVVVRAVGADGPAVTVHRLEGADREEKAVQVYGTRFDAWPDPCTLLPENTLPGGGRPYDRRPAARFSAPHATCTLIPHDEHEHVVRIGVAWLSSTPSFADRILAAVRASDEQYGPLMRRPPDLGKGAYLRPDVNVHNQRDQALVAAGGLVVVLRVEDDEQATMKYAKILAARLRNE
ncbi:hypothetical protein [Nonomuraea sp. NPDC049607]|uniref:hypothetical protein n=1 Tax=Nonomuraea sp. NPDC049607 TaxID=3154732 RepID=UPI0034283095